MMKEIEKLDWNPGAHDSTAYVYAAQFAKGLSDTILAGSSGRNEMKIYEKEKTYAPSRTIGNLENGVFSLDVSENGTKMAFGCSNGELFTFDIK